MLELKLTDFKEFKDEIYSKYLELFPEEERKSLKILKKLYKKNFSNF